MEETFCFEKSSILLKTERDHGLSSPKAILTT